MDMPEHVFQTITALLKRGIRENVQRVTVTLKKVAGMEVVSLTVL